MKNLKYLILGSLFGFILTKTEVISWFRIQEMFRFQSFHMYGVIGSALAVGALSVFLLKRLEIKSVNGENVQVDPKKFHWGTLIGGLIFGFGWALTGACPGPIFALIGNGNLIYLLVFVSALVGTWVYGFLREKLPH